MSKRGLDELVEEVKEKRSKLLNDPDTPKAELDLTPEGYNVIKYLYLNQHANAARVFIDMVKDPQNGRDWNVYQWDHMIRNLRGGIYANFFREQNVYNRLINERYSEEDARRYRKFLVETYGNYSPKWLYFSMEVSRGSRARFQKRVDKKYEVIVVKDVGVWVYPLANDFDLPGLGRSTRVQQFDGINFRDFMFLSAYHLLRNGYKLNIFQTGTGNDDEYTINCAVCDTPAASACSRCNAPYCSEQCQRRDWAQHRQTCLIK